MSLSCPSCQDKAMSYWAKIWCAPESPVLCKSCGILLAVRYRGLLWLISLFGFTAFWYTFYFFLLVGADYRVSLVLSLIVTLSINFVIIWFLPIYLSLRESAKFKKRNI